MEFVWYRNSSLKEKASPAEKLYFGELAVSGEKIIKIEIRRRCSRGVEASRRPRIAVSGTKSVDKTRVLVKK
ncbi:hypothetical protein F2Q68_00043831 [Brassica cretica]|uniref:Uncharacterized protein n=1 Tax=Brassica cretica TaxID=69181 RepID=A0A8S9LHV4_BRACR|nr:hypothetical protein F2Q68_00043831 [Brassica cretica]